jgi:hypothetical protein
MKKYIQGVIETLKLIYPNEKIDIENGFIGVKNGDRLKHTTYLGEAYWMIDNVIYTDYNKHNESKKLMTITQ